MAHKHFKSQFDKLSDSLTKTLQVSINELKIGHIFADRYQILEELGKGGMGRVYKALDKQIDEEVALKLIKPLIASDEKTLERFRNELKLARKISHKNVCRMYHFEKEKGTPYITMEYVEGKDLKSFIRNKGRLSTEEAIGIAKQMCEGLSEAHELGIIHRDLKPQNVMIDKRGYAKIMDFGIAKSVEAPGFTQTGMIIGTPDYLSPEQAEGEEADQRSDIYSLGVILYEMVTGRVPFKGDTALSVALKHKAELPQAPRNLIPDISGNLNRLILICLEKNKESRYQSVAELFSDLINIEKGHSISESEPEAEITRVAKWKISIAVLPFVDLSPQKDQEYFCDGMAEELINSLTKIKDLRVVARTSAFSFKGKDVDIHEIGKKLDVKTVLEGSVRKAGTRLRITAQLVNVEDDSHIWSDQYDRDLDDVFAIQDEVGLAIVESLKCKLHGEEKSRLVGRRPDNPEAYNLYLKGRYFANKGGPEELNQSIKFFREALDKDPTYARAYLGMASSYNMQGFWRFLFPREAFPKARACAEKALKIDETLCEAHNALAFISLVYDWDWPAAEKGFNRGIELKPGYAYAHHFKAIYLSGMGRHGKALEEMRIAQELDPLSLMINTNVGTVLYHNRSYDQAIEQYQKTLEMDPNYRQALHQLGKVYTMKGEYEAAMATFQKAKDLGLPWAIGGIGFTLGMSGQTAEAKKLLNEMIEMSKTKYVFPASMVWIYAALGDADGAFEWLEKCYEERDTWMFWFKYFPEFDKIRSDPRFDDMLKRLNL